MKEKESNIFDKNSAKIKVREEIRFHLFISEPPCGDSSLLYQDEAEEK